MALSDRGVKLNEWRTIGEVIRSHAALRPEQPAFIASGYAPLSYKELEDQIDEIRSCLRQGGFDGNARIAVGFQDNAEAALAIVVIACSAVAVPLDPKLTFTEVERCLGILRPNAVLLLQGSNSVARDVAEHLRLTIIEAKAAKEGRLSLQLLFPEFRSSPLVGADADAPAFILHTSGTTADPNLIPFSHRGMLAAAERLRTWYDLTPNDRCLSVVPVNYSHGLKVTVLTPLLTGGSVAFPFNASKVDLSEWLGVLRPTWYSAGPALHLTIVDKARARPDAKTMHSLRFIISGGAPLPGDAYEDLQGVFGVPVLELYGSSEAAFIASSVPPPGPSKVGTCGIPWPDTIIIVGDDARRLPPGEQGEILVSGPTLTSGYLNAPELNRSSFVEGWFLTGDIGSLDEEGFLSLHGRKKELINRGGQKVAPLEIDRALMRHPDVTEAAAYAVSHPRLGEDVAAAVVLRPGSSVAPIDLREFLSEQLATFKVPRRITIVDHLPKGSTGKVQRKRLSESSKENYEQCPASDASLHADLLRLWKKLLKTEHISIDDDFFEIGGDSLLVLDLHTELERLMGKELPQTIIFDVSTVRQLAKKLSYPVGLQSRSVQFTSDVGETPLVFFHGCEEGSLVRDLARGLGAEQLIFVFPFPGNAQPRLIEDIAADQISLILEVQPSGPYRLGGHREGALVALEAARLLILAGHNVDVVAMLDPTSIAAHGLVKRLLTLFARVWRQQNRQVENVTGKYFPAPLAVPLLVFSTDHESRAWLRISPDVEVISLAGNRSDSNTNHSAAMTSYLRARLQSIDDPRLVGAIGVSRIKGAPKSSH